MTPGERVLFTVVWFACCIMSACGSSVDYARAVDIHNVFRRVILDVDKVYAPMIAAADASAAATFAKDDAGYQAAMAPWLSGVDALRVAKESENTMRVIVDSKTSDSLLANVAACAADAVEKLGLSLGQTPQGDRLWSTVFVVATPLRQLAAGATCETPHR